MSPEQIVDNLTYSCYAENRRRSPEVSPERWAKIFPNAEALESLYQREQGQYSGTLVVDLQTLATSVMDAERRYVEEVSKQRCAFSRCDEYGVWTCHQPSTGKCDGCGMWICDKHLWIVQTAPDTCNIMCAGCASAVN